MNEPLLTLALPMLAAIVAGGLIGLDREWRGRAAGFRTHILVCLSSAVLMQAAVNQGAWGFHGVPGANIVADPARLAHGILTGIGFLCAGVIFRTGFSIHGLTSAASVWTTAALGLLFGAGLFELGAMATALSVIVLVGFRVITRGLRRRSIIDVQVAWPREAPLDAEVEAVLKRHCFKLSPDAYELSEDGRKVQRSWKIETRGAANFTPLADALNAIPGVSGYRLDPRDD